MPHNAVPQDLFWSIVDWVVRAAGSILLLVITFGWKDWRRKVARLDEIHELCKDMRETLAEHRAAITDIAVMKAEIKHLQEGRRG